MFLILIIVSCNKKDTGENQNQASKDFSWKSELKISDIPDMPVKGFINGKEVKIEYINFEKWRGSGDNVINFGDVKPKNNCGYIEGGTTFHIMHKSGEIKSGELLKAGFDQNLDGYIAYYDTLKTEITEFKSGIPWNCALVITEMKDDKVKGKIAICFKDDSKSWVAGTFEAIKCNN
ncbi:MAG: hypothetical protein HGGPFJEG_03013 [Ignavibacteria bacterium]|nr:hypothetical protein [Ignavibacteria bacterium]